MQHQFSSPSRRQRLVALRADREALIARSAVLREQLASRVTQLEPLVLRAQQVRAGWRWAGAHRQELRALGLALLAGLVLIRPRRAWRLMRRTWSLWRWWHRLRQRIKPTGSPEGTGPIWQHGVLLWLLKLLGR